MAIEPLPRYRIVAVYDPASATDLNVLTNGEGVVAFTNAATGAEAGSYTATMRYRGNGKGYNALAIGQDVQISYRADSVDSDREKKLLAVHGATGNGNPENDVILYTRPGADMAGCWLTGVAEASRSKVAICGENRADY